jgi:DNA helicase-2/ATP-dependent DNA helicase PcrA
MDFDDLLMKTVLLFEKHPEILASYQDQFHYIHVDEWQDTNTSQYVLITKLAQKHRNIAVVGDDAQCVPPDTKILTPGGLKEIKDLVVGESVISASGMGDATTTQVLRIKKFHFRGPLIKITTVNNRIIRTTPHHIIFTRLQPREDIYYVYLMYRHDKGFRIGITKGAHWNKNGFQIGLLVIWIDSEGPFKAEDRVIELPL